MADLRELYQEVIFDHNRHPRNFGPLDGANHVAEGHNPLCGDLIDLRLQVEDGVVREARFEGAGCAISTASASLMTEALVGKSVEMAHQLFSEFHELIVGNGDQGEHLGKLIIFSGVRGYPSRVKCATLAWHTLEAALEGSVQPVTTE